MSAGRQSQPAYWIGIERGWDNVSADPLRYFVRMSPGDHAVHTYVLGKTGSGKTNLLHNFISVDLRKRHSLIVLDLRGDLVRAALEIAARWADPATTFVLDLRERDRLPVFNPLAGSGPTYVRALAAHDLIASEFDSFGPQLSEYLRNALLLLAECGEPLSRIGSIFYDGAYLARCLEAAKSRELALFWDRYGALPEDRKGSLASPVLNKLGPLLAMPGIRRVLGPGESFDLAKHLATPGSLTLISLAADETSASGRMLGKLILSSVCREFFARVSIPVSERVPVRLYVDEFENFGTSDFESILAEGRKYKITLVLAHQTLAQLNAKFRSLLLNGVGFKAYFRTGREDGSAMSKDLTGNAKAFDFTTLRTGEAVVWRSGRTPFVMEVNAPIVRDTGTLSPAAQAFLEQVYRRPEYRVRPEPPAGDAAPKQRSAAPKADLGDWL